MASLGGLAEINSAIHDEYFNVDAICFDADAGEVRLTIFPGKWRRLRFGWWTGSLPDPLPPMRGELVVRKVLNLDVHDGSQIGFVTVNHLAFDARRHRVLLEANEAVLLTMHVDGLSVELLVPEPDQAPVA